jgi:hypothetical protein
MIKISDATVKAVEDKAYQQTPEDFSADFLATLRLENRDLHRMTEDMLSRFLMITAPQGMSLEEMKALLDDEDKVEKLAEATWDRVKMAQQSRLLASMLVGLVYKCMQTTIEAKELEEEHGSAKG